MSARAEAIYRPAETDGLAAALRQFGRGSPMQVAPAAGQDGLYPLGSLVGLRLAAPPRELGAHGRMRWVDIRELYIDPLNHRPLTGADWEGIRAIAAAFTWSKFSPLVVERRTHGSDGRARFAVIHGQRRALAAATHGRIRELPCLVIGAGKAARAVAK